MWESWVMPSGAAPARQCRGRPVGAHSNNPMERAARTLLICAFRSHALPTFDDRLPAAAASRQATRTRVWDLPTRLFHWALAAAVIGLIATGLGGVMEWHFRLGYAVLALLLFRLVWGFVGGRWSRFTAFVYAPGSVLAYLRGRAHPDHLIGHTPLGALSVFAVLAILALQVATGLVADDGSRPRGRSRASSRAIS